MNHNMDLLMTMTGTFLNECFGAEDNKMPEEIIGASGGDEFNGNVIMEGEKRKTAFESLSRSCRIDILSYLTPHDLLLFRFVSKSWNDLVTSSPQFLSSIIFKVTPSSSEVFSSTVTPWSNISLSHSEIATFQNLSPARLKPIKILQIESSTLSLPSLSSLLCKLPTLQCLTLADCSIITDPAEPPETESVCSLECLRLQSSADLDTIIKTMSMINQNMMVVWKEFSVTYTGPSSPPAEDIYSFCTHLLGLITKNESTLQSLTVNVRKTELLNAFCSQVLQNYDGILEKLEVFQLCPHVLEETPCCEANPQILSNFFLRHDLLKIVSFPHFVCCCNDARRRKIFRSLPGTVEHATLPGHSYLVPEFLTHLPSLKSLTIGGASSRAFHPNGLRYSPNVCNKVEVLGLYTRIHLSPGKLANFAWKFPALTKFEFDAFRPLLNDFDLQSVIMNCKYLRHLSIAECDFITDFGLTGAPVEWCKDVYRLGVIYMNTPERMPRRGNFKPIATLKGLMTMKLTGNSGLTDVGLFYGLRFLELRHLWLPSADQVTGWGFRQLGHWNPSLDYLNISATDITNYGALKELSETHPRLSLDNIVVDRWYKSPQHRLSSPCMLTAVVGADRKS